MVVVVDDQEDIRELLAMFLESELNVQTIQFALAKDALEYIKKEPASIEAILSDYNLSDLNGFVLFEKMSHLSIPCILLTGEQQPGTQEQMSHFLEASKNRFLLKPIDAEDIVKVVKSLL